ncbi:hypothetical protein [Methylobacterium sp. WSM2598]|uniref:hypothetical protein n=1 Tax=Methylobacterium sp. WSM2598 TaxID=398261 RepID=UPI00037452A9|nr:hypothetical protein [Methylobacterium sp. WSM2598]
MIGTTARVAVAMMSLVGVAGASPGGEGGPASPRTAPRREGLVAQVPSPEHRPRGARTRVGGDDPPGSAAPARPRGSGPIRRGAAKGPGAA